MHDGRQQANAERLGTSRLRHALACASVAGTVALSVSGSAVALGEGEPPLVTEEPCGYVLPMAKPGELLDAAGEPYWAAVPPDRVLVPVIYSQGPTPAPSPQEVLAGLTIEAVDEMGSVVQGQVTDVQSSSGWLLTWTPEVPLEPGQYTGRVRGGEFPEHPATIECGPGYNFGGIEYTKYSFPFAVEDAWQEWVDGAELTLSPAAGGGVTTGCCRTSDCEGDDCVQCWDQWGQRGIHAEWTGTGIAYLDKQVRPITDNLQGSTLAAFGEYCVEGTVSASGIESRTIEACGILTEDEYLEMLDAVESPREECRTLVRATTCQSLPEGMTELSTLFVVYGSNEEDARAALAAAPYHVLEGCLSNDSPSQPSTPGDASTPAIRPDGGSIVSAPDASRSDAGTEPDTTQGEADASMMSAPSTSRPDASSPTSTASPRGDSGKPVPVLFEDPSYGDCGCRIADRGRGAPSRWALLAVLAGLALRRRAKPWKTSRWRSSAGVG